MLTTYSKLKKQITEKRYYPALKTLEELEHLHLPHIANYRFSLQLRESIPKYLCAYKLFCCSDIFNCRIRESIEKASMSDLKDFLENIRRFSPKIGEVAMRHVSHVDKLSAFIKFVPNIYDNIGFFFLLLSTF